MGRPRGAYPRHVQRRDRQIAKGMSPDIEWRIYSISVAKGSKIDKRLQDMRKGHVSAYVREILQSVGVTDRLRVGDVRTMDEYRCVWTEDGWEVIE